MITLFTPNETDFSTNGLGSLDKDIMDPVVEEKLNALYSFSFTYPIFAKHGGQINGGAVVRVPTPDGKQLFRIYKSVKNMGYLNVYCYHISYDLVDNIIEDTNIVERDGQGAISQLSGATQYGHSFKFYSDITKTASARIVRMNPIEALLDTGQENTFINRWGGEVRRENFNIFMNTVVGANRGVTIRHRKDLLGYEAEVDWSTVTTRIMPKGYDGLLLPEKYVDSPLIANYPYPKIKTFEYNNIKAAIGDNENAEDAIPLETAYQMLREAATQEFSVNQVDLPKATYKVEFVPLSKTEEYKGFENLQTILIGDTVTVIHEEDGLNIQARMNHYKYDPLAQRYISVELGNYLENFSSTQSKVQSLYEKVGELQETTNTIQLSADGKNTIYRGTATPQNPSVGDLWYNSQGDGVLMQQWTGVAWELLATSADSLVGTINFENVNAINFNADSITTGKLRSFLVFIGPDSTYEEGYDPSTKADGSIVNEIVYKVEIISSNGLVFKNGQISTLLQAKVYHGADDVTDTIDANRFRWKRVSNEPAGDEAWNTSHAGGTKEITVTQDDVKVRATFTCEVLDIDLT